MKRWLRVVATLVVTALAVAYIVLKIDLGKTLDILGSASVPWVIASAVLTLVTVPPMAWRWQQLLAVRGVHERVPWLTRTYFVSYAVGADPADLGRRRRVAHLRDGAAPSRAWARRSRARCCSSARSAAPSRCCSPVSASCSRSGGTRSAPTSGPRRSSSSPTILAGFVFFSRAVRKRLAFALPAARRFRIERPARAVYEGIHGYRDHPWTLLVVCAVSVALQLTRVLAIYASGRAVGIHLSVLPYIVLGPLLFLVMLVPFTVNGLGVREAFFVSFLGNLGVDADAAFACGFLFFVMTILLALPGLAVILWEQVFGRPAPRSKGAMPERSG